MAQQRPNVTPAQWQQLTEDKAFSYKNDQETIKQPEKHKPGLMEQMLQILFALFGSGIGNVLLWIVLACVLLYVAYRFLQNKESFLFSRNKRNMSDTSPPQESGDVAATDWEQLLQQANENNDTRLAIRYTYMWLLQMLQERELIRYRTDKTNYDYYTELADTAFKQPFKQLSRQYEYAWYGHYTISPAAYNDYTALFNNLRNQLGK